MYAPTEIHGITVDFTETMDEFPCIGLSEIEQTAEFVKRIQPLYSKIAVMDDVEYFTNLYLPERPLCDDDITRRYHYILNMIMLENESEAVEHLELLKTSKYLLNDESERENWYIDKLSEALSHGIVVAKNKLLEWESENKRKYNIR